MCKVKTYGSTGYQLTENKGLYIGAILLITIESLSKDNGNIYEKGSPKYNLALS